MAGKSKEEKIRKGLPSKEELSKLINERAVELGRKPKRADMDPKDLDQIKRVFGKWCYALEESGQQTPSEKTLERRKHKREKWERKHHKMRGRKPGESDEKGAIQPEE